MLATESQLPEEVYSTLKENCSFIKLGEGKRPLGSYASPNSKNRLKDIPNSNYGVIPTGRILVLDLDTKADIKSQTKAFSKIFGVELENTFKVLTPSGGVHYYLLAPEPILKGGSSLPKGSLRGRIAEVLKEAYQIPDDLDGDLRSPQQTGYVVGPGSTIPSGSYRGVASTIAAIPEASYSKLKKVVESHYQQSNIKKTDGKPRDAKNGKTRKSHQKYAALQPHKLSSGSIKLLRKVLENSSADTFHGKRAVIARLTGCCTPLEELGSLCKDLGINRDTYSNREISDRALLDDLRRYMGKVGELHHGGVGCEKEKLVVHKGLYGPSVKNPFESDAEFKKYFYPFARRGKVIGKKDYRVLSMDKILDALTAIANKNSNVVRDSYAIVEHFLQPLSNSGAKTIILGKKKLKEYFRASDSRMTAALRILRKAGVLEILKASASPRSGVPGRTTVYKVSSKWNDEVLTRILRKTWHSHVLESDHRIHPSVSFLHRERTFVDSISGQILFITEEKEKKFKPSQLVPKKLGEVLHSYLANEVALRVSDEGAVVRSTPWNSSMIVLKTLDDEIFTPGTLGELSGKFDVEEPPEVETDRSWMENTPSLLEIVDGVLVWSSIFDEAGEATESPPRGSQPIVEGKDKKQLEASVSEGS